MSQFSSLTSRFVRDERGAFAVIFALMAIVLVALSGATVDYVSLEQMRNRGQIALDAATLALQPEIFKTPIDIADIKKRAEGLLLDRLGGEHGVTASLYDPKVDLASGTLTLEASMIVPTVFVALVGVDTMNARILSQATRIKLALEVAFVLDNSGSMSNTGAGVNGTRQRIQFLKDAANCATNVLFYSAVVTNSSNPDTCVAAPGATLVNNVRVAVVPFTIFVNVGAGNAGKSWIDKTGTSLIANDNYDTDDNQATLPGNPAASAAPNHFAMFAATKEAWRGCVEARAHIKTGSASTEYLDTDDTVPLYNNTLFAPMLSPDMVDGVGTNDYLVDTPSICDRPAQGSTSCTVTEQRSCFLLFCSGASTTSVQPTGPTNFNNSSKYAGAYYGGHTSSCSCRSYSWSNWSYGSSQTRTGTCTGGGYIPQGLSQRDLQERVCKYYGSVTTSSFSTGPNADCTRTAILPLTSTPSSVTSTINTMQAEGGTNIHEGTAWGARVLSPSEPFSQGDAFGTATSKVMIVMTDGENTSYNLGNYCSSTQLGLNGSCYNSAYGFPYNSRNTSTTSSSAGNIERIGVLGTSNNNLVAEMNTRTNQTCENAKAAGITIYTIGLATDQAQQSSQAVVEKMLTDCASTSQRAFFPQTPGELRAVFENIANDLSALRLSQ
ncbi:MAG: hypothetical protein ACOH2N_10865 [Devosia sp.]